MIRHEDIHASMFRLIRSGTVKWAGNSKLRIYGKLSCSSGKRMMIGNRVFFTSAAEAIALGFRPCGHCLKKQYTTWKTEQEAG